MLKGRSRKKIIIIILILFVSGLLLFFPVIISLSDYLSKTEKTEANLLIVEGWLPPYAIEMAYNEFKENSYDRIITTGIKMSGYYQVYSNGYLVFYPSEMLKASNIAGDHTIEIDAYSQLEANNSAHFNVFVNDSLIADFYADKKKRRYEIPWKGNLAEIDSVMVNFDNDKVDESGDRNLYVKEIIFDHKIHISYQNNSEYDIGLLDGKKRIKNNFTSYAELARNELLSMGLDSSLVLAIQGNRVRINRTLTSALAFRDWLNKSDFGIKGINIITLGTHARRTWMTYNKILNEKYNIGIISLPDYRNLHSRKNRVIKTLRETLGIVYYWFILIPY